MLLIVALTALTVAIALPLWWIVRSDRRLTWTTATLMGMWLTVIGMLLIAEIPSRMLYWFDSTHTALAEHIPIAPLAAFMEGDTYIIIRDIVVNTIQGAFFVLLFVLAYLWGERQRKAGRFKA
ncbi:MAG TPA: hypothetical protein VM840_05520 [Actinomycetota bacterium]|jgi:hypothetical protein|nr:hypothetical protein [Actinomycetota bacterium]